MWRAGFSWGCTLIPHPDVLVRSLGVLALHGCPRAESGRGQPRGFGEEKVAKFNILQVSWMEGDGGS